jgi:hypothetical protein
VLELSLHILDIVENSTRAGAKLVHIDIIEDPGRDLLSLEIRDNGSGMSQEVLKKVMDPFFTTKTVRNVGLGIPMLAQAAERTGGTFTIESKGGKGTKIMAEFRLSHPDRQPLGNMASTLATIVAGNTDVDFIYRHRHDGRQYVFNTRTIRKEIGNVPMNHVKVLGFIKNHVQNGLEKIGTEA